MSCWRLSCQWSPASESLIGYMLRILTVKPGSPWSASLGLAVCLMHPLVSSGMENAQWPTYGGDMGGTRYSVLSQINGKNVGRLKIAWSYHTGALEPASPLNRIAAFEATPVLSNGTLYLSTPFDQVIALDALTGKERWKYDPRVDRSLNHSGVTSRGVAVWRESAPNTRGKTAAFCGERVFIGTLDARLIALDAASGQLCASFGSGGVVDLSKDVEFHSVIQYKVTSPPTVVGDVIVVGSSILDNQRVDAELGVVRGFDARSGRLRWTWDPIPWAKKKSLRTGAGNAWSTISADVERGLIFVPTGSASPDYYGGLRPGDNRHANSVVALEAATGKFVWGFQVVHHDLWDYDVAAQPLLFTFRDGTPAVAVSTKMGTVFVLDRRSGKALYPVEERPVPKSDIPGELASPTQPFSSLPSLGPQTFSAKDTWGATPEDLAFCRGAVGALRSGGIYTPPTLTGTLLFPGNVGGVNWGSTALDPKSGVLYANTNRVAFLVKLVPRNDEINYWQLGANLLRRLFDQPTVPSAAERLILQERALRNRFTGEFSRQDQTPYFVYREAIMTPGGLPCTAPPWGTLSALNLNTGQKAWDMPLGTMIPGQSTGSINLGGPIVTAGGLVFTAASTESYLRAFDSATGQELWKGQLPVPAQATPMTYMAGGRQYVVICAGGHGQLGTKVGDSVIAFALP
jgi:quinoprotein glucose dehydrogenase